MFEGRAHETLSLIILRVHNDKWKYECTWKELIDI